MGRVKSSLGSEQFLDFAKRAACCLEARKEVTDGERQSPEADKMFQNGFGVTKYVIITSLCVIWNNAIVHSFASSFWLRVIRIKDQNQESGSRNQEGSSEGQRVRI